MSTAPVRKPFPWGFVAGVAVLVLALGGILVYAVQNTGSGFRTAADRLDDTFDGIEVTENQSASHVAQRVAYPSAATQAPTGGDHNAVPQTCAVYDAAVVPEHAVHSMEHGAVWITYQPGLPQDQVDVLKGIAEANPSYRLLSPYPGQEAPVALQAWGRRLEASSATDSRVQRFADEYTEGPQTREQGAACSGVDQPGTVPFVQGPDGSLVPFDQVPTAPAPSAPATGETAPAPAESAPAPAESAPVPAPSS